MTTKKKEEDRPTEAEIAAWKKEHKAVFELEAEDGGIAILRRPTMFDLERAIMASQKKGAKPMDFQRNIADNCLVWSSPGFRDDDEREKQLVSYANELSATSESRTRKL